MPYGSCLEYQKVIFERWLSGSKQIEISRFYGISKSRVTALLHKEIRRRGVTIPKKTPIETLKDKLI